MTGFTTGTIDSDQTFLSWQENDDYSKYSKRQWINWGKKQEGSESYTEDQ
jgi:hypothetical protein